MLSLPVLARELLAAELELAPSETSKESPRRNPNNGSSRGLVELSSEIIETELSASI